MLHLGPRKNHRPDGRRTGRPRLDRAWCYLGSANFDDRSFDINAEVGLGIPDESVCVLLAEAFEKDLESARRMAPGRWHRRRLGKRAVEWAAYLIREQL